MDIPIGTFLSKVQYTDSQGRLPDAQMADPTQPFHFVVMKMKPESETDEVVLFQITTYEHFKKLCHSLHAFYHQFRGLLHEAPDFYSSKGFNCVFSVHDKWNCLLVLATSYQFPRSFLNSALEKITISLSAVFEKPDYHAANFVLQALIWFSKYLTNCPGIPSVLSAYKPPTKNLEETQDVFPDIHLNDAIQDKEIYNRCSIFTFNRLLFSTMNKEDLSISELLVANLKTTTSEVKLLDGSVFCLARHFNTVFVSISDPEKSLERCCSMQVSLMNLDSTNIVKKMEKALGKILPPQGSIDVLVTSNNLTVSQPPFYAAPIFQDKDAFLEANSISSLMCEPISTAETTAAVVRYYVQNEKALFNLTYTKEGESGTFTTSSKVIHRDEVKQIPSLLRNVRN